MPAPIVVTPETTGARIAALRLSRRIRPRDLAAGAGLSIWRLSKIEHASGLPVTLPELAGIAGYLGVRVSVLIGEERFDAAHAVEGLP